MFSRWVFLINISRLKLKQQKNRYLYVMVDEEDSWRYASTPNALSNKYFQNHESRTLQSLFHIKSTWQTSINKSSTWQIPMHKKQLDKVQSINDDGRSIKSPHRQSLIDKNSTWQAWLSLTNSIEYRCTKMHQQTESTTVLKIDEGISSKKSKYGNKTVHSDDA